MTAHDDEICPNCHAYIDVDFSHYNEYDGRPVYVASCKCPPVEVPVKDTSWEQKGFFNKIRFINRPKVK